MAQEKTKEKTERLYEEHEMVSSGLKEQNAGKVSVT